MKFLQRIKKKRAEKLFLKKKTTHSRLMKKFTNLNDAQTIGIIYDDVKKEKTQTILKFIKKLIREGKKVRSIGYIPDQMHLSNHMRYSYIHYYCEKDTKPIGKPILIQISNFMNTPFDILIDLCSVNELPTKYVVAFSQAKLKTGMYASEKDYLDVMIKTENLNQFLKHIVNYLYSIK